MPSPGANLAATLFGRATAAGWSDRIALREPDRAWTWAQLADRVARVASALRAIGIGKGERVAVFMPDSLEAAAAILGAIHMGAVAAPLSELARPNDVRSYLADSEAVVAIVHGRLEPAVDQIRRSLPGLREVICVGSRGPGERDFATLVDEAAPAEEACAVEPDDLALLLYSAGVAEDAPRGVPHTHHTPIVAFESYAKGTLGLSERDRVFSVVRVSTAYGLGTGLLFPLSAGAEAMLLPQQPHTSDILPVIESFAPTAFFATPSVYGQLARDVEEAGLAPPLGKVRACVSGAEGMPPKLVARVRHLLGTEVLVGYGLTEAFQFVLATRPDAVRSGSCGRPVAGCEARIVSDDGDPVDPNEIGTLEIRGPTVAKSYWHRSDDDGRFRSGWLRTRDRFMVDDEGYYYHCGRVDDLFKVGGKWVSPSEVERALLGHEAVWECAVVGADDEDGLVKPLAFVVANIGHSPGTELEAELREYVKQELAPYKYPRWIEFLDELPRGPTGKVLRYKLRSKSRRRRAETAQS